MGKAVQDDRPESAVRAPRRWQWATVTVAGLGLLSLGMLFWTDAINQRQHAQFAFANALMDLRIRLATAHLWLEEGINGGNASATETERARVDLDEALRLSRVLLEGGICDDLVVEPPRDTEVLRQAQDVARLVSAWNEIARERRRRPQIAGEGSELESRDDRLFDQAQAQAAALETRVELSLSAAQVGSRRLLVGILVAWSCVVLASTTGLLRRELRRRRAEDALRDAKDTLEATVAHRTSALRLLNDDLARELAERRKTEDALRDTETQLRLLSASLLTAQETERARVSRELHDELGHALVLMKLELGHVGKTMASDARAAEAGLGALAESIDRSIEAVRRLCRDLQPAVLEDLGLTAALKWLLDQHDPDTHGVVCSSFADVDHLLPPQAQLVLYRIAQEAVTNARKHARARRISLCIERHGECLYMTVDDDGHGFDPADASMREATERGLGLATMHERARMLGGTLQIGGGAGQGTRIALTVPLPGELAG